MQRFKHGFFYPLINEVKTSITGSINFTQNRLSDIWLEFLFLFSKVFLSDTGILHILPSDHSCVTEFLLAESSLVDLAMHDLVLMNQGMEILIATADGNLICVGSGYETPPEELVEKDFQLMHHALSYPFDQLSHSNFGFKLKKVISYVYNIFIRIIFGII